MKYTATFLLLAVLVTTAAAQPITITADEFIKGDTGNFFSSINYNQDSINVQSVKNSFFALIAISGAGITWDFGNIEGYDLNIYNGSSTTTYLPFPGGAPLEDDPDFKGATFIAKYTPKNPSNPTFYGFFKFNDTGFWQLGETRQDSNGTKRKVISNVPPLQEYKFPLTYGTSWHSEINVNSSFEPTGTIYTDTTNYVIDSYGTLISPTTVPPSPKVSSNCLRMKGTDIQTIDSAGVGKKITVYKITSYSWITNTGYGAGVGLNGGIPYYASYNQGVLNSVNELPSSDNMLVLRLSSNPISNSGMKISCTVKNEGNLEINLFDAIGKNIRTIAHMHAAPGENIIPFDPGFLPNGSYFIHATTDGMTATGKVIIQR